MFKQFKNQSLKKNFAFKIVSLAQKLISVMVLCFLIIFYRVAQNVCRESNEMNITGRNNDYLHHSLAPGLRGRDEKKEASISACLAKLCEREKKAGLKKKTTERTSGTASRRKIHRKIGDNQSTGCRSCKTRPQLQTTVIRHAVRRIAKPDRFRWQNSITLIHLSYRFIFLIQFLFHF